MSPVCSAPIVRFRSRSVISPAAMQLASRRSGSGGGQAGTATGAGMKLQRLLWALVGCLMIVVLRLGWRWRMS